MTLSRSRAGEPYTSIFVEKVPLVCVKAYDKKLFNTNNYGTDRPDDYNHQCEQHETRHWAASLPDRWCETVVIPAKHVKWMMEASELAQKLGKFPAHNNSDDLDEAVEELQSSFDAALRAANARREEDETSSTFLGFFVRSESVSLKYGIHGAGPYMELRKILESVCTTIPAHTPLPKKTEGVTDITLYLFPWRPELANALEMRVFVHKDRVTAMSQQHLYSAHDEWKGLPLGALRLFAERVLKHFEEIVKGKVVGYTDSYTYDLGVLWPASGGTRDDLLQAGQLYFIEPNPFGAQYSAGAALFDWRYDGERLLNDRGDVFMRITIDDETDEY